MSRSPSSVLLLAGYVKKRFVKSSRFRILRITYGMSTKSPVFFTARTAMSLSEHLGHTLVRKSCRPGVVNFPSTRAGARHGKRCFLALFPFRLRMPSFVCPQHGWPSARPCCTNRLCVSKQQQRQRGCGTGLIEGGTTV